ncbi:unnamed protein product [Caenorhabditis angaria]|uniref:Mic1 domain-containing protein n=1 Tax=Caenorhabditis angaria TaxID=860376 RepID=A0A9P1IVW5_9PELO|nr:unnamed protein product [Caenorhabditis angaria]
MRRQFPRGSSPKTAYLIEIVVETLADGNEMDKLQQIVTYRVINDSKPLAFLLLSYEARCSTLFQSGVDILARNKASDEIVEVMLEKQHIVDAFRFIDARNLNESIIPKVVEAAKHCSRQTQYAIKEHLTEKKAKATIINSLPDLYEQSEIDKTANELATCQSFEV